MEYNVYDEPTVWAFVRIVRLFLRIWGLRSPERRELCCKSSVSTEKNLPGL